MQMIDGVKDAIEYKFEVRTEIKLDKIVENCGNEAIVRILGQSVQLKLGEN